jgi:hypothetical protein
MAFEVFAINRACVDIFQERMAKVPNKIAVMKPTTWRESDQPLQHSRGRALHGDILPMMGKGWTKVERIR